MKKRNIIIVCIMLLMVGVLSGCVDEVEGTGVITDKWSSIVKAGFGSREAYFFEINDEFFIETSQFDYHNYEINQSYDYDSVINPSYT